MLVSAGSCVATRKMNLGFRFKHAGDDWYQEDIVVELPEKIAMNEEHVVEGLVLCCDHVTRVISAG